MSAKPLTPAEIAEMTHPAIKEWSHHTRTIGGETRNLPWQIELARHRALVAGDGLVRALQAAERHLDDLAAAVALAVRDLDECNFPKGASVRLRDALADIRALTPRAPE